MSSHVVDKLVMELELELSKFKSQTKEAIRDFDNIKKTVKETGETSDNAAQATAKQGNATEKAGKQAATANKSFLATLKSLRGIFAAITTSVALERLGNSIAKANDNLYFMQQRLNMNSRAIKTFSNAAAALGGDAGAMTATMQGLNQSIQNLVMMGDASILPFFNALGVGVTDAYGQVRAMDDILLDMADSFHEMKPEQGYALASAMGIDDATANALMQGRAAMLEMMGMQKNMYTSTQQELAASRELRKAQALLSSHWEGLKTMLGNAIIPLLTKLTEGAQTFVNFLMRHERSVKNVMEALAYVIGGVLVVALGKAAVAAWALMAPFAPLVAVVAGLGAAFILLYDDYKTWAEGGESLFDWGKFIDRIEKAQDAAEKVGRSLQRMGSAALYAVTGYTNLDDAMRGAEDWLKTKGFIDETGVSLESLGRGIQNVVKDIIEAVPILKTFAEIISKLQKGDFIGAFNAALELPMAAGETVAEGAGWIIERGAGTLDVLLGGNPDDDISFAGEIRNAREAWRNYSVSDAVWGSVSGGARKASNWLGGVADTASSGISSWWGGLWGNDEPVVDAVSFARGGGYSMGTSHNNSVQNDLTVNVGGIVVNTSASDLPTITSEALRETVKASSDPLTQIAGGL